MFLTGLLLLSVLVSCGARSSTTQGPGGGVPAPAPVEGGGLFGDGRTPAPTTVPRATAPPQAPGQAPVFGSTIPASPDQMIVRTGRMALIVEDVSAAIDEITRLALSSQGYVVSSNSFRDGERQRGAITIRVPVGDFDNVMKLVAQIAVEVTSQTTSADDVTEEYVDLGAKLKNLEAAEQQLLRIMEKAEKVEDILSVQREITNTRAQIEQTKGRMQFLEQTSSTSLLEITLEQSKLEVKFTAERRFVESGETVRFAAQVAGGFAPYSYKWDFGDGKTGNDPSPAHAYGGTGDYTVSLTVTDDRGNTDTATTTDYVTAAGGWSAGNVAVSAWNGLAAFGRVLLNIVIWLGIFSPVWIIAGGIVLWRVRRRKKA
ncbi:MAG: hypothetical protein A2147_00870 [Chloroflexi bacterium RBG_16_57_8]|nr:MAG: hypothetical protein A2147_00870 [Chloroflexi bacterium RBG_16_57_8]